MDIVYIRDFRIETVIGMFQWERRITQTLALDLEMAWDIRPAAASDRIDDALDYKAVSMRLKSHVEQAEYQLVRRWPSPSGPSCARSSRCPGCACA